MSEATFRFSTLSDQGGIERMSRNLFGGVDAMEEIYPILMADPNFNGVVGESDGEIIAFGGAYVFMGGRKLYSFGGRVKSDWRGKQVYGKLKEFLRNRLRQEQYPLLAQEEFFTHGDNPALQGLLNSKTYRLICTRIAFGGAYVFMGGRKLYSFGGRVKSDWRGKQVYGKLKEFLRNRLRQEQYPLLAQEEFFTHGDNPALQGLLNSKTYRLICTRSFELYNFTSDERSCSLKGEKTSKSAIRVENVGVSGLMSMLNDPEMCRRLFPDRLFSGMLMFDPDLHNYALIEKSDPVVVVSPAETSGFSFVSTGRKHKPSQYIIQFHFETETIPLSPVLAKRFLSHLNKHLEITASSKQYKAFCLLAPKIQFSETMDLIEFSGFEGEKIFENRTMYGFCRNI